IRPRPSEVRVLREDSTVHVLERAKESARLFREHLFVEAARKPDVARRDEEQSHCVHAVTTNDGPGIDDVAATLRHLETLRVEHHVVYHDGTIRRRGCP